MDLEDPMHVLKATGILSLLSDLVAPRTRNHWEMFQKIHKWHLLLLSLLMISSCSVTDLRIPNEAICLVAGDHAPFRGMCKDVQSMCGRNDHG